VRDPGATIAALGEARIIAVVRAPGADVAVRTADALLEGGLRAVELTFTTPGVEDALARLVARHPDAAVGAGTIARPEQAERAASAGAAFLVSAGSSPSLVAAMVATGLAAIPGCLTPSEILAASAAGAHAVKIFPASTLGPGYLAALRGPFPSLRLVPTGGIDPADVRAWIDAGAFAVGLGGRLARPVVDDETYRAVVASAQAACGLSTRSVDGG